MQLTVRIEEFSIIIKYGNEIGAPSTSCGNAPALPSKFLAKWYIDGKRRGVFD